MNRLIIIPDEEIEAMGPSLLNSLARVADQIRAGNLVDFLGEVEIGVLAPVENGSQVHELLLWGLEDRGYGVAWTSLAPAEEVVSAASATATDGLVNEVFALGHSAVRSSGDLQAANWTNLERRRGRVIDSMAASPVLIMGKCIAVLTLAQYDLGVAQRSLTREDAAGLTAQAALLGRLLEDRLIRALLGLKSA